MKEKPILFSSPMVKAILDGSKTQTRRVIKPQPIWIGDPSVQFKTQDCNPKGIIKCPYGQPGDRLWVREKFSYPTGYSYVGGIWYWADGQPDKGDWIKPKPSIHMPRWASRITLEVVSVRVERLQDISESDSRAEGVRYSEEEIRPYTCAFVDLWDSINAKLGYGWDVNPWVWVVEFKRVIK